MSSMIIRCTKTQCEIIRHIAKTAACYSTAIKNEDTLKTSPKVTPRLAEFRKKLREKVPFNHLEEMSGPHPQQEKEPLKPWPNNTNPYTGEIGGPAGPEPTRYGDWERKGRVTDF